MKYPYEDLSVFRAEIIDHVVDEYMIDLYSNLHASHSSCIESEIVLDHMSELYLIKFLTMFQEVHIPLTFFMR